MICDYHISLRGRSHLGNGKPCQDSSDSLPLDSHTSLAVVADGVGSCRFADKASAKAVETFVSTVKRLNKGNDYIALIKQGFSEAKRSVSLLAEAEGNPVSEYETTMTAAIYDGNTVYYGHSGDGGIIGLEDNGAYVKITHPQKGPDGISVLPLSYETNWVFGKYKGLASVLLATDGVYDRFFPYLLKLTDIELYVPLAEYFMNNNGLKIMKENQESYAKEAETYLLSDNCDITDDMTIALLVNNEKFPARMPEHYYVEPDWEALQEKWKEGPIQKKKVDPNMRITKVRGPEVYCWTGAREQYKLYQKGKK